MKKIVTAIVAGGIIAYGAKLAYDELSKESDQEVTEDLIRNQSVYDILDGKKLMDWHFAQQKKHPGRTLFFLGKATKNTADILAIGRLPEKMDADHTVFQALIDENAADVLEFRMITFSKMSAKVLESFENREYIIMDTSKE